MTLKDELQDLIDRGYKISHIMSIIEDILIEKGLPDREIFNLKHTRYIVEDYDSINWNFSREETYSI